jgi:hypothetical protein
VFICAVQILLLKCHIMIMSYSALDLCDEIRGIADSEPRGHGVA